MTTFLKVLLSISLTVALAACGDDEPTLAVDGGSDVDMNVVDDAGPTDDAGPADLDAGPTDDAGITDDAGSTDDAGV